MADSPFSTCGVAVVKKSTTTGPGRTWTLAVRISCLPSEVIALSLYSVSRSGLTTVLPLPGGTVPSPGWIVIWTALSICQVSWVGSPRVIESGSARKIDCGGGGRATETLARFEAWPAAL